MRNRLFFLLTVSCMARLAASTHAQERSPADLDRMLAPIALYPDPLVAVILPAAAAPADILLATQYLHGGGAIDQVDFQPWDQSVKALAHYPEIVLWLGANPAYTEALGAAFTEQPSEVMQAIQRLRARALAAGTLVSTPQEVVVVEDGTICIEPAEDGIIYIPQYDPSLVYGPPPGYAGPFFTFGAAFAAGPWLNYECDWDDFGIWIGGWHRHWGYHRDWVSGLRGGPWRPDPQHLRAPGGHRPVGAPARTPSLPAVTRPSPSPGRAGFPGTSPNVRPHPVESRPQRPSPRPAPSESHERRPS